MIKAVSAVDVHSSDSSQLWVPAVIAYSSSAIYDAFLRPSTWGEEGERECCIDAHRGPPSNYDSGSGPVVDWNRLVAVFLAGRESMVAASCL